MSDERWDTVNIVLAILCVLIGFLNLYLYWGTHEAWAWIGVILGWLTALCAEVKIKATKMGIK